MAVGGVTFNSDDVVVKSPNDRRLYRYIQLENGLCALIVHDPEIYPDGAPEPSKALANTEEEDEAEEEEEEDEDEYSEDDDDDEDEGEEEEVDDEVEGQEKRKKSTSQTKKAAAAMCVGMGSFSDPLEAQGLAHFLEHMLFMGSADFPDENEYDSYLSKHGGSSNAYTEAEHTCYHFEVNREFLKGALRRFSQFFISPLVKIDAMEREVLAVDSEFNQVLQSDACRLQQLQCHTSAPGHPFNKFSWGNRKSLIDAMEKGINLREQILKLYKDNYHGGLMKLVVIGGESLDVLENWVLELFNNVRKGPWVKPESKVEVPIWKVGKLYRLEAVKDVHILDLSWTLPCLRQDYLKKSEDYLAHLIGHEMLTGKPLFPGKNVVEQLDLVTDLLGTPPPESIARIRNEKARRYLNNMRKKSPIPFSWKFPNADPLAVRLLERLLAFDPKKRPSAKEALADPYFHGLANADYEPSTQPISKFLFSFERRRLTKQDVRELIYREILEYHPLMLQQYLQGTDLTSFMYPSGVDRFKQQFAHLEEHHGKGARTAPRLRQHTSLPRERVCAPIDDPVNQTNGFEKRSAASVGRPTLQSPPRFKGINVSEYKNKKVTTIQNEAHKPNYNACDLMKSPSVSASKCMDVKRRDYEDEVIPKQNGEAAKRLSQNVAALSA